MNIRSRLAAAVLALLAGTMMPLDASVAQAQANREGTSLPAGPGAIAEFNVVALDGVRPGDELKLSMTGAPGGQAAAEVAGIPERITLAEVRRGVYEGAYTVRRQDRPQTPLVATGFLKVDGVESLQRYPREATGTPLAAAASGCPTCGVVEAVNVVEAKGDGKNVIGTIAGGVLGGVLGHQVGSGRGKDLATVAGAVGGAYAGNRTQNSMSKTMEHHVVVRLADGTTRTFVYPADPGMRAGDQVRVENGTAVRR